jgi:tartrate dehydratase alpha subunit/fumarate hydratase class I-like protein
MKTAVEWFYNEIKHIVPNDYVKKYEQAKEMEKEQIVKHSVELTKILISHSFKTRGKTPTELVYNYFNETFKQQEQ